MARTRVASRGFSLAEVLVAGAVGLILTAAVIRLLVSGARLFAYGQARADLQAAGLAALGQLSRELRESSLSTLTATGNAVCFRPPPQEGELSRYQPGPRWAVAYLDPGRQALIHFTSPAGGTGSLAPAALATLLASPSHEQERVLAPWVKRFTVTTQGYCVSLRLELSEPLGTSRTVEQTVDATVAPRNRL